MTTSENSVVEGISSENIVENLYKKNIEILHKNKTLSLLSKLYEISILTLDPKDLALKLSQTVLSELSFDFVGIYKYEIETDSLMPLGHADSEKVKNTAKNLNISFENVSIPDVKTRDFFNQCILLKKENLTKKFLEVWEGLIDPLLLKKFIAESNIKTTLLHPLVVENKILGVILLSINRNYEALSSFEAESIKSFVNVIALALEKSYLYKELESANSQLRELDRQKDELLSIVSHQLAAPITAIKWYLELLEDGSSEKERKEYFGTMQGITANLSDLVSMLLDVSRIQLGKMKPDKKEIALTEFFTPILQVVIPKANASGVQFKHNIVEGLPNAVIDKRLTRMTIENLLTNAIKYTPKDGLVTLHVECKNNEMHCTVTDTGFGIPLAEQSKIFGKLYRASNVRNTVEGNGFGLYVAKGAMESQGGKLWFESTEGKGTTFFATLPLK